MSYQIKRTPYFRRIFNNSRRNGQLQRLREEYERIQEFNDRTIEMKMRQVRLKRLFREIEDINESTPSTSNHHHAHSTAAAMLPLTPEAQQEQQRRLRLETLERARELGQEMSRRNAELAENGTGFYLRSELRSTAKMRAADAARREAQERRQRAARRISYGNAQSRSNVKRIAQRRERQEAYTAFLFASTNHRRTSLQLQAQLQESQPHPDIVKRSMLQQRLQYGNSRSSNNMMRSQLAAAHRVMNCISLPGGGEHGNLPQQQLSNRGMRLELEYRGHSSRTNNNNNNDNNRIIIDNSINGLVNRDMDHQHRIEDDNRIVQLEMEYHSLPTSSKNQIINNNDIINDNKISNCNALNAESDVEMQTAMLPPTEEPETLHSSDDDMPTTSRRASARMTTDVATMATTTISGFQSPRPSRILRDSSSLSERASERWHRISLTLPWFKVIHDHPIPIIAPAAGACAVAVEQQLPHNSISISIAENLDNSSNTNNTTAASGASDNYQSFRGPSLMQEDLMQIMELNETNDNVPVAPVRVVRRTSGN